MKIISKYKDYYDFYQGVYGQDEKIVYVRGSLPWIPSGNSFFKLSICATEYHLFTYDGETYFGLEGAEEVNDLLIQNEGRMYKNKTYRDMIERYLSQFNSSKATRWWGRVDINPHMSETDINDKLECPVILEQMDYVFSVRETILNPRLSDLNMASILPANEIYLQIGTFLSREKPVVDNRDDNARLESAGFDKKTSFRKM
jgi:hypothetical protein